MMRNILAITTLTFVLAAPAAALQQPPPKPTPAQEGFVPIDQLPPQESVPAQPLVAGAYAFAWLAIAGYTFSIWRRLTRVERELQDALRRAEGSGRRAG
jgi:CcmD family protein